VEDKANRIKKNIEATIVNAIETDAQIRGMDSSKQKSDLISKNERRAEAIPSLIREYKEEEAKKELGLEER
jgi:hypothetical protein